MSSFSSGTSPTEALAVHSMPEPVFGRERLQRGEGQRRVKTSLYLGDLLVSTCGLRQEGQLSTTPGPLLAMCEPSPITSHCDGADDPMATACRKRVFLRHGQ
jgi:hypothetical protein